MEYCDTELCLNSSSKATSFSGAPEEEKPITIIYRGGMFTCDATEIQAREIICKAKQDMERSFKNSLDSNESKLVNKNPIVYTKADTGLSMKRSLQRFLLRRRSLRRRTSLDSCLSHS